MDPLIVSAKFPALVWFSQGKPDHLVNRQAARRYADQNWGAFVPNAHEGLGRLLMRIGAPRRKRTRRRHANAELLLATV